MPLADKSLINSANRAKISGTQCSVFLSEHTDLNWSPEQIQYMNRKESLIIDSLTPCTSSADSLIQAFKSRNDVSWLMISHEPTSGFFIVSKNGKTKFASENFHDTNADEIRSEMTLSITQNLILIFAWVTDEELRLIHMFPEFFAFDVTCKTCKERRDMFVACSKDGNNHGFHGVHAYIPCQKRWLFSCLFSTCIPLLWGDSLLSRIRLTLTDGDTNEFLPLGDAIKSGHFRNSVHGLCMFHLLLQGFKKFVSASKRSTEEENAYTWIRSWFTEVETFPELKLFQRMFFEWLGSDQSTTINDLTKQRLKEFVTTKLIGIESLWARPYRLFIQGMDVNTTNIAESLNSSTKQGYLSTTPNMAIHKSAVTQVMKSNYKSKEKTKHLFNSLNKSHIYTKKKKEDGDITDDKVEYNQFSDLDDLTDYAFKIAKKNYEARGNYSVVQISCSEWWVYNSRKKISGYPTFQRIRRCIFVDSMHMTCTCGFPMRCKMPCIHVYAVVGKISKKFFHIRWWKSFMINYGREGHEEETIMYTKVLDAPYVGIMIDSMLLQHATTPVNYPLMKNCDLDTYLRMKLVIERADKGHATLVSPQVCNLTEDKNLTDTGMISDGNANLMFNDMGLQLSRSDYSYQLIAYTQECQEESMMEMNTEELQSYNTVIELSK